MRSQAFLFVTGLAFVAGPLSFQVSAQDYIDVEAERAARATPTVSSGASTGARSYGLDSAPAGPATVRSSPAPVQEQSFGTLLIQLQQLQQDVMRLNGKVEEQTHQIERLKEQSLERYLDIDRRLAGGASVAPGTTSNGSSTAAVSASPAATGATEAAERPGEGDAYRAAYALVRGQEFNSAVAAFKQFLERFPDGRYAPNAHYWLGELYMVLQPPDPEAARQSFMLLLDQYPGNAKEPDALYKLGKVHFAKGNRERAREFLQRAISQYPQSSAAGLAREFLDQNL